MMKNSHKESARFKAECVKYENDLLQQEGESEKLTKKFAEQKERYLRLRNEVMQLIVFVRLFAK